MKIGFAILKTIWQDLVTIPREASQAFLTHREMCVILDPRVRDKLGSNTGGIPNELVLCYTNEITTVRSNNKST